MSPVAWVWVFVALYWAYCIFWGIKGGGLARARTRAGLFCDYFLNPSRPEADILRKPYFPSGEESSVRRAWISILFVAVISSLAIGCGQAGGSSDISKSNGSAESMLALLPKEATGIFFLDIQKAMSIPVAKKALARNHAKLDEFIAETGLDPTTDVFSLAGAVSDQAKGEEADGVVVMSVKVDAEALIAKIEEKNGELAEEDYQGVTIFVLPSKNDGKDAHLAFLDDATVAMGTLPEVRAVIDVHQKRADSILKNTELMAILKDTNQNVILWAAFVFTEEEMEDLTEGNPMMSSLSGIQSVLVNFDYKDRMFTALIECQSDSEEQNQQIADFLTGIKSFAAMGSSENPALGELLRTIEITSSPENIRVSADIPEELLQKLDTSEKS